MTLLKLDVFSVRNIHSATLLPSPAINLVTGANASGKSSLLEAIFILGRTRSFRTNHVKQAITFDKPNLIVSAQNRYANGSISMIGIKVDSKSHEIRIDQENKSKADLAYALPMQIIHPKSYRLLDGGPQLRREFLDWGIFNQEKNFLPTWRKFNKVLQQRNALLKNRQITQLSAWDRELIEYGLVVNELRKAYLQNLQPIFLEIARQFLPTSEIELCFNSGWDETLPFEQVLKNNQEKDLRYGFTNSGPHRADFLTFHDRKPAKDFLSRGQQKLLVLALLLSQVKLLGREGLSRCCVLVDDLTAELDSENRGKLLEYLSLLACQVFMTATELSEFGDLSAIRNYKLFHVEHGCVQ